MLFKKRKVVGFLGQKEKYNITKITANTCTFATLVNASNFKSAGSMLNSRSLDLQSSLPMVRLRQIVIFRLLWIELNNIIVLLIASVHDWILYQILIYDNNT